VSICTWRGRDVDIGLDAEVDVGLRAGDRHPPLSPIRGGGRITGSIENCQRLLDLHPSPMNGVTLCQGNFTLMRDLPGAIRLFRDKIRTACRNGYASSRVRVSPGAMKTCGSRACGSTGWFPTGATEAAKMGIASRDIQASLGLHALCSRRARLSV
jgi:hypothetical protein